MIKQSTEERGRGTGWEGPWRGREVVLKVAETEVVKEWERRGDGVRYQKEGKGGGDWTWRLVWGYSKGDREVDM